MKEIEIDNNVGSKTPDEIKKGLQYCSENTWCAGSECPYYEIIDCDKCIAKDALAYIEQLERERDAAIEDIPKAATFLCQTCKKYHPAVIDGTKHFCDEIPADHFDDGAIACGMYEWRGVKEEKDENTSKWTNVAEHLPQKPGKYLVYSKVGTMYTSKFDPDIHKRWPHFGKVGVTHWMPRPEEPKE